MQERRSEEHPDNEKKGSVVKTFYISGLLGTMCGGPAYGIARLLANEDTANRWGLGVGGGFAAGAAGAGLANLSFGRVEDYLEQGRFQRARFEAARGVLASTIGYGIAGGLVGFETGSLTNAAIGAGIGIIIGGQGSYWEYKDRIRSFPELIVPPGNSIYRDMSFPDRKEGIKYPPVYRVTSLKDLLEFREVNKEAIIKWAISIPYRSNNPSSLMAKNLATSVVIIPDLQHFPGYDPKETSDMKLSDASESILVHPSKDSHSFWSFRTRFESIIGESRHFEQKAWQSWREISWRETTVLLVQYQKSEIFNKPTVETVSDNYWLLDILDDDRGHRGVVKRAPQSKGIPVFRPQQA